MRNSFFIWIPSIQKHLCFYELSNIQYRTILKHLDDDSNLNYLVNINRIIKENLISDYPSELFTIIDRFIIFISFKIQFSGDELHLSKPCSKCSKTTKLYLNLNTVLAFLQDKIDRSFKTTIHQPNHPIKIICDVPTIQKEFNHLLYNADRNIIKPLSEYSFDEYVTEFVHSLHINDMEYLMDDSCIENQNILLGQLPFNVFETIKDQFIIPLHNIFDKVVFFDFNCVCGEKFSMKMGTGNINEMTKLFYRDNTLESWLRGYTRVIKNLNYDAEFLNNMTNVEILMLNEMVNELQQSSSESSAPPSEDLFESYSNEVANLRSTPSSEFS
jgi:hypothetical protein